MCFPGLEEKLLEAIGLESECEVRSPMLMMGAVGGWGVPHT